MKYINYYYYYIIINVTFRIKEKFDILQLPVTRGIKHWSHGTDEKNGYANNSLALYRYCLRSRYLSLTFIISTDYIVIAIRNCY